MKDDVQNFSKACMLLLCKPPRSLSDLNNLLDLILGFIRDHPGHINEFRKVLRVAADLQNAPYIANMLSAAVLKYMPIEYISTYYAVPYLHSLEFCALLQDLEQRDGETYALEILSFLGMVSLGSGLTDFIPNKFGRLNN